MLSRRATVGGLGGLAASFALPGGSAAQSRSKPPRLRAGDTVGLIAPASSDDNPQNLLNAQNTVRGMGLVPKLGRHVSDQVGYLSGTDRDRAADVNAMFADPSVRAIFSIRGGWGSARLLPLLDWRTIRANPKLLVGLSDVTGLHLAIAAHAGFPSVHAPNVTNRWDVATWNSFYRMAFAGEAPVLESTPGAITTTRPGVARGRLLGGNLTVLSTLMGTPWLPDFTRAILFLEDVGEAEYRIDRMLNQLALSGVLRRVSGVIFGRCSRCASDVPNYAGFTLPQILEQHFAGLGVPVFSGANFGHVANQLSLPSGAEVEIDAGKGSIRLLQPIVA